MKYYEKYQCSIRQYALVYCRLFCKCKFLDFLKFLYRARPTTQEGGARQGGMQIINFNYLPTCVSNQKRRLALGLNNDSEQSVLYSMPIVCLLTKKTLFEFHYPDELGCQIQALTAHRHRPKYQIYRHIFLNTENTAYLRFLPWMYKIVSISVI